MVITMQTRLSQQAIRQGKMLDTVLFNESLRHDLYESEMSYRFSIGQLPQWAKKQLSEQSILSTSPTRSVAAPKGRWAQRAENVAGVQSFHGSEPLPFPFKGKQLTLITKVTFCFFFLFLINTGYEVGKQIVSDKKMDSDGSKESSLDSGTEVKLYQEKKETLVSSKVS